MSRSARRASSRSAVSAPLIAVVGPTASGKSGLALDLAERLGGEIVGMDSLQVYRGLDIGSAKPTAEERSRVPHHLLDVVAPDAPYSAGSYVQDAAPTIASIQARGSLPVLCGGTGLYYRALLFGLVDVPDIPKSVQVAVQQRVAAEGTQSAHRRLAQIDPKAASGINVNDPVRIARALEVYEATGRPLSAYRQETPFEAQAPGMLVMGIAWERKELYGRINARVESMLAQGWIAEVEGLLRAGYAPDCKPLRSIGYAEIVAMLTGAAGLRDPSTLANAIAQKTRRYAKRQLTWFRRHPEVHWVAPERLGEAQVLARNYLLEHGLRR